MSFRFVAFRTVSHAAGTICACPEAERPWSNSLWLNLSMPVGPDFGSDNISMERLHYADRRKNESPACGPTNHPDGVARRLYTGSLSSCGTNEASNLDFPLCGKRSQWNVQSRHQIGRSKILSADFGNLSLCELARGKSKSSLDDRRYRARHKSR